MTYLQELGVLALASRLKLLSETLMADGIRIYRESGVDFEPRWFPVTYFLKTHGPTPLTTIAKALNQSHPAVVQVVRILEKKGLVIRLQDEKDSRINRVSLSERGKEMIGRLESVWADINQAANSLLNEQAPHFIDSLVKIENALMDTSNYTRIKREQLKRKPLLPEILPFNQIHLRTYRELNLDWLKQYVGVTPHDKRILKDPVKEVLEKGGQIYMIRIDQDIIGTFTITPLENMHCELSKFVVSKEYRRLGIGYKMMDVAIGKAREADYRSILLLTHTNLKEATQLYVKKGFSEIPGHSGLIDHTGRCSVAMQLKLNQ
jgi:DNA-binding MarR family transcriptional regulator/N-acetylglutamate synthase-like GNAT family acetyltransferase